MTENMINPSSRRSSGFVQKASFAHGNQGSILKDISNQMTQNEELNFSDVIKSGRPSLAGNMEKPSSRRVSLNQSNLNTSIQAPVSARMSTSFNKENDVQSQYAQSRRESMVHQPIIEEQENSQPLSSKSVTFQDNKIDRRNSFAQYKPSEESNTFRNRFSDSRLLQSTLNSSNLLANKASTLAENDPSAIKPRNFDADSDSLISGEVKEECQTVQGQRANFFKSTGFKVIVGLFIVAMIGGLVFAFAFNSNVQETQSFEADLKMFSNNAREEYNRIKNILKENNKINTEKLKSEILAKYDNTMWEQINDIKSQENSIFESIEVDNEANREEFWNLQ